MTRRTHFIQFDRKEHVITTKLKRLGNNELTRYLTIFDRKRFGLSRPNKGISNVCIYISREET